MAPGMNQLYCALIACLIGISLVNCQNSTENGNIKRAKKGLGIFSVVRFPNSACYGTNSLNGTCYTSEECTNKGGLSVGACASSFGVCCTFQPGCGSTTSENCTYHTVTSFSTTTNTSPCTYTVCPASTSVCKLRLDLMTFTINGPYTVVTAINANIDADPRVGDCTTDSFTVTNPGGTSAPVICGKNDGQHMYVDASTLCNKLHFNIDTNTVATRSWNVKVTQLECTQDNTDHECLQFLTGLSGTFASFNFDTSSTTVTPSKTMYQLNDQYYSVCFRRESGYCGLCFSPVVPGADATSPTFSSFGISASKDADASQGANDADCTGDTGDPEKNYWNDYITVNGLLDPTASPATSSLTYAAATHADKLCGHVFAAISGTATTSKTACTYRIPYKWGVHFDDQEITAAKGTATLNVLENNAGSVGFWMQYWQTTC